MDYQGRQLDIDFLLTPYYGTAPLSFSAALKTLSVTYKRTLLYTERNNAATTGLDALAVRAATGIDPAFPIPLQSLNRLTLDCEGLVLNADGTYVSFSSSEDLFCVLMEI